MRIFALAALAATSCLSLAPLVAQADETRAQAFFSFPIGGDARASWLEDSRLGLQFARETQLDDSGIRTEMPEYQTKTFNFVDVQFAGNGDAKALALMGTDVLVDEQYRLNAGESDMRQFYIWGGAAVGITLIACLAAECFNDDDDDNFQQNALLVGKE